MGRKKGAHRRRLMATPGNGGNREGRTIPVYVTQSEWDRLSTAASDQGVTASHFVKRAALGLAQTHEMQAVTDFDPDGPQPDFP